MKLGVHRGSKVTEPDFSGKLSFSKKYGKRSQKGLKIKFLHFWAKFSHYLLFPRNDLKWSVLWLGKFWENFRSQELGQKNAKIGFLDFYGKFSHYFLLENGLKWRVLRLANFLHKSHICENSYSLYLCVKALDQSERSIFQITIFFEPFNRFFIIVCI